MAQKMQTYDETRLVKKVTLEYRRNTKWVPQESQDYVLRSPNVERKKIFQSGGYWEVIVKNSLLNEGMYISIWYFLQQRHTELG